MRIHLIAPALPPALDGIGDYSARLAAELARSERVKLIAPVADEIRPVANVEIEQAFSLRRRRSVAGIGDVIAADKPEWVVLQFNQFSYGRWGFNPFLPFALRWRPGTRLAVMFHEDFVPPTNWKFRVMRLWQRRQFQSLGRAADLVLFSIDSWVRSYASWFLGKPVVHLPVGSNIDEVTLTREAARKELGLRNGRLVFGLFGSGHGAAMLGRVRLVATRARQAGLDAVLLYIGTNGSAVRQAVTDIEVRDQGPLPSEEVSRRLRCVDVFLTPFIDGVSTRRGSMMAGLQHGLATVGTDGPLTDQILRRHDGTALVLTPVASAEAWAEQAMRLAGDAPLRQRLGRAARELYRREFDWPVISRHLLDALRAAANPVDAARRATRTR